VHLHTLACKDEETFLRIKKELQEAGILYSG
jgi:transcriptional regulator of NAD metabolism